MLSSKKGGLVFDVDALINNKGDAYFKQFLKEHAAAHSVHCEYLFNIYIFLYTYEKRDERRADLLARFYELHCHRKNIVDEQLAFISAERLVALKTCLERAVYDRELFTAIKLEIKSTLDEIYMPLFLNSPLFKKYQDEKNIDLAVFENIPSNVAVSGLTKKTPSVSSLNSNSTKRSGGATAKTPRAAERSSSLSKSTMLSSSATSLSKSSSISAISSSSSVPVNKRVEKKTTTSQSRTSLLARSVHDLTLTNDANKTLSKPPQSVASSNKSLVAPKATKEAAHVPLSEVNPNAFASQLVNKLERLTLDDDTTSGAKKSSAPSAATKLASNTSTRSLLASTKFASNTLDSHLDNHLSQMDRLNASKLSTASHNRKSTSSSTAKKQHHHQHSTTSLILPPQFALPPPPPPLPAPCKEVDIEILVGNKQPHLDSGVSTRSGSGCSGSERVITWLGQLPASTEKKHHHHHHKHDSQLPPLPQQQQQQPLHKIQIVYQMPGEQVPYLSTYQSPHTELTLADFKKLINKKGYFRYYFMTKMENVFGVGGKELPVKEEINDDMAILPKFGDKIIAHIENCLDV